MPETLLIGIGAQKAGTTWLAEFLRDHQPDVHLPLVKEVHFFDNYCMPTYGGYFEEQRFEAFKAKVQSLNMESIGDANINALLLAQLHRFHGVRSPAAYLEFLNRGRKSETILCDITPDYALLDRAGFELMKSVHENVKIVFLLRNPADRFWSSLRFNRTHNRSFDIDQNFDNMLVRQDFVRFANYDRTIRALLDVFNPENLHIAFYENLFTDAATQLFCDWLGVPFVSGDYGNLSNAAVHEELTEARRKHVVTAYQQTYREIAARFGDDLPDSWRVDMEKYL